MSENSLIENIFQIFLAGIGSIGFALALNVKKKHILVGGIGGAFSWGIYLIFSYLSFSVFTASLISAIFVYFYSAIFSKIKKAPLTVFFAPTVIPLLPGGSLYYTIFSLIEENKENFYLYGKDTLNISMGLVIGFIICSVIWQKFFRQYRIIG